MRKELELGERFPQTGEPTVQIAAFRNTRGGLSIEKRAFDESQSPLYDFLKTVTPIVGCTFVLVNAMGAFETYDDNRNGDGFNEFPFKVGERATCGHPDCTLPIDGWVSAKEVLPLHYKTFEEFAGIYQHHVNKDPSKSLGKVEKALWNPRMHRVELLLRVNNAKEPMLIERIGSGDFPAVSMGTHVKWDVCTICGHRAPTRAQYCDHALNHMREVLADGRKVCVLNPSPRFFDISFVFRPADPTGWTMQKVARESVRLSALIGEELDRQTRRSYFFLKTAEEVFGGWGDPSNMLGRYVQQLPATTYQPDPTLSLAGLLTELRPQGEVLKLAAAENGLSLSEHAIDRLVLSTPALVGLLGRHEATFKGASYGTVGDVLRERAFSPADSFAPEIGPGALYRAAEPQRTEMLTITDPYTGHVYQTTRGSAIAAGNSDIKKRLLNTALFSALYAAGLHHILQKKVNRTLLALPLAVGLGHLTEKKMRSVFAPYRNPEYMTDQGIPVSGGTEFKAASLTPTTWAEKLASDCIERVGTPLRVDLEARVRQDGGARFLKWASLSLPSQVDALTHDALDTTDPYAVSLNLNALSDNLMALVTI